MKPATRKEMFMEALAKGCACNVEPVTREERFLAAQAEREASGGSGGGFDLVIARDFDAYTATLVKGSYEAIDKKLRSGEAPTVYCYMIAYNEPNDPVYEIYKVHRIEYNGPDGDRHISCYIGDGTSQAFYLHSDNSVEYWEYND